MSSVELDDRGLKELIKKTSFGSVTRWVHDGVEYGIYQEMGFHHWISGKHIINPFLRPAIEANRASWTAAAKQAGLHNAIDIVEKVAADVVKIAKDLAPKDTTALTGSLTWSEERPA